MSTTPSTTTASPAFVLTAHLAAEIVEQLADAGVAIYSVNITGGMYRPAIGLFPEADGQSAVDNVAAMFDLAPDDGKGQHYTRKGTVHGVEVSVWTSRDEVPA